MSDTTTRLILDGDPSGLVAAMNRAKGVVRDGADDMSLAGGGIVRSLAGATAGFISFGAAAAVMGLAVRGFIENENAVTQLEARLKSTNGVAGQTSEGLQEMASSLQKTTTFADDMTIAAQALLLTFTNIRGPIFEEAIVSIQDMSIALGQDLQSSTIQLGKALNDPIKGITALSRVGVSFTAEQKETIKTMVELGNVTGAQKLILQELQTEFGGAAVAAKNTLGGALTSLNNAFGDMLESVVGSGLEGGGIIGGIHSLTEAFERSKPIVHTFQAEIIRMAMLADKAGGSLTALGYASSKVAFAGTKFFTIGNFGDGFDEKAKKFDGLNKMFEERYKANERMLQALANQEVGLDADGNPVKPKTIAATGGAPTGGGATASPPKWVEAGVSNLDAMRASRSKIFQEMAEDEAIYNRINYNGGMTGPQQKDFDISSDTAAIEARKTESNRRDEQAEFEHTQVLAGLQNTLAQKKMLSRSEESEALYAQFVFEQQQADAQTQWKLDHTYLEEEEISRIKAEHGERRLIAEQELAQRQADLWAQGAQTYLGFAESMTTLGVSMLLSEEQQKGEIGSRMLATSVRFIAQGLQNFMFSKAKEHLLAAASLKGQIAAKATQATSEMAIGATQATAWAAFYAAHSLNPIGAAVYGASAAAMTAAAGGFGAAGAAVLGVGAAGAGATVAGELGMAAAWGAGGVAVGAIGSAGATAIESGNSGNAAGYGGGTSFSPVITQPVGGTQGGGINITVKIEGNVISDDRWVEERLAPAIKDLATNRNVDFGLVTV